MHIRTDDFAFDDAVAIVATANTVGALHKRLVAHPLVQYLADKFTAIQIEHKLLEELNAFDRTLHRAAIILLLTLAYFRALGKPPIPGTIKTALASSEAPWVREMVQFYEPRNEVPMAVVRIPTTVSPKLHQSASSEITQPTVS